MKANAKLAASVALGTQFPKKSKLTFIFVLTALLLLMFSMPAHAVKGRQSVPFTYVIMGDPQYPWWPELDMPSGCNYTAADTSTTPDLLGNCSSNDQKGTKDGSSCKDWTWKEDPSKCAADIENQNKVDGIKDVTNLTWPDTGADVRTPKAVIINGDLTAFFHDWQLEKYEEFYIDKLSDFPVLPGLGNHDYQNNAGDCGWPDTYTCYKNAVEFTREYITGARASNFPGYWVDHYDPDSLSYSWSHAHYLFIQLHNYPSYDVNKGDHSVDKSWSWVKDQLAEADEDGKYVILNFHDYFALTETQRNDLADSPVVGIFVGHQLYRLGHTETVSDDADGDGIDIGADIENKFGDTIPVWHSGHSGSEGSTGTIYHHKILLAEFGDQEMTVAVIDVQDGDASFDETTLGYSKYKTHSFSQPSDHQLIPPVKGFVAVGVPKEDVKKESGDKNNAGQVNITFWNDLGNVSSGQWSQGNFASSSVESNDEHGTAVASGDFNGDGYFDLAAGAPFDDIKDNSISNGGVLSVVYGTDNGLTGDIQILTQESLAGSREDEDRIAEALAVGDFNNDDYDDLAIGVPHEDIGCDDGGGNNAGIVLMVYGSSSGLDSSTSVFFDQDSVGTCESDDRFGSALAAGDFDNDGYDDLAASAIGEDLGGENDAGIVKVMYGTSSGISSSGYHTFSQESIAGSDFKTDQNEANDQFGFSLTTGDFDEDGYDDLAAGVPYEDINCDGDGNDSDGDNAGKVVVAFGSSSGITRTGAITINSKSFSSGNACESDDRLGYALAAGDFNGDGDDDLAIGVPGEDLQNGEDKKQNDAGNVIYLFGSSSTPLGTSSYQNLNSSGDAPGAVEANDHLGWALAAGDADLDGYDDLAIAVPDEDFDGANNNGLVYLLFGQSGGLDWSNYKQISASNTTRVISDGSDNEDKFGLAITITGAIRDTEPPVLNLPSDMTVEATKPEGADVSFTATADDDFDGPVPVDCTPASGSTFDLGTTTVSCSAADEAGNVANGNFDVTVVDTTPPDVTVPDDITVTATKPEGADVSWSASAFDIVDENITPTCDPVSGSTFAHLDTTVTCEATDNAGNTGSNDFTVTVENAQPTADDQGVNLDEDTSLNITLTGDDVDDYPNALLAFIVVDDVSNGTLTGTPPDLNYAPDQHWFGIDIFTFKTNDGELDSEIATVTITVDAVNDKPVIMIDRVTASLQYSDTIGTVTITATDVDDDLLTLSSTWSKDDSLPANGLPSSLGWIGGCTPTDYDYSPVSGTSCSWTFSGQMLEPSGDYDVYFTVTDAGGGTADNTILTDMGSTELIVSPENASIAFDGNNIVAVQVTADGSDASEPFSLIFDVWESMPDNATFTALAGDISNAIPEVMIKLSPVGPGSTASPVSCGNINNGTSGYAEKLTFTCNFDAVPVNTYSVDVSINGGYYTGFDEDVLTVFDPSLGFTTGGGWFYWPGTSDKTNFGYTMKYNKKRTSLQGSLMLIRHIEGAPEGEDKWRIKSNSLHGLALGSETDFSWAVFDGKTTYKAPGMDNEGNHEFTVYVEDHGQPGAGADRVWLEVRDKLDDVIPDLSMDEPATSKAETIEGGNIFVPHQGGGGKP